MGIERARRGLAAGATTIALAAAAIVTAAPAAQAARCATGGQTITELKGITCRSAKSVHRALSSAANLPECRGDSAVALLGWRATAAPVGTGGVGIGTKFTKRGQSFRASGGGTC